MLIKIDENSFFFLDILTFVKWRTLPGRGRVPIMDVGESKTVRKSPESMNKAIAETNLQNSIGEARKRGIMAFDYDSSPQNLFNSEHPMVKYTDSFSNQTKLALQAYVNVDYIPMNRTLRRGEYATRETKDQIRLISDAIENSRSTESFRVYRGTHRLKLEKGQTLVDDGFGSVSLTRKTAEEFTLSFGSTVLEFDLPKGSKVIQLMDKSYETAKLSEMIVQRGSKYHVKSIRDDFRITDGAKIKVATLELVSQEPQSLEFQEKKELNPNDKNRFIWNPGDIRFIEEKTSK